jgi:AcrR family transcriptional regulator
MNGMSIRWRMVKQKTTAPKLGRQDWIDYGLRVLAQSGVEAVRVEPLAKLMQVTKGSFYWHFKDRQEWLDALVAEWVKVQTNSIIELINAIDADAKTKLLRLFEIANEDDGKVELAIRAWGTSDTKVAAVLAVVDQQRLDYTRDLFLAIGFSPEQAQVRAQTAYYALVGEFTIGIHSDRAKRIHEAQLQHAILTANCNP